MDSPSCGYLRLHEIFKKAQAQQRNFGIYTATEENLGTVLWAQTKKTAKLLKNCETVMYETLADSERERASECEREYVYYIININREI